MNRREFLKMAGDGFSETLAGGRLCANRDDQHPSRLNALWFSCEDTRPGYAETSQCGANEKSRILSTVMTSCFSTCGSGFSASTSGA